MRKQFLRLLSAGLLMFGFSPFAHATILQTWDDEAAFLTANSSYILESFETTSSSSLPLVAGGVTVTTDNTTYSDFNGVTNSGVTDGVQAVRYGADSGDSIYFAFENAINSFGINIWSFGTTGGNPVLTLYDGLGNFETVLTAGMSNFEFFGFTSDLDVVTVQFTSTGGGLGDGIYFDELYYTEAAPVPEPSSILLLSAGLAGVAGLKLKRKKA